MQKGNEQDRRWLRGLMETYEKVLLRFCFLMLQDLFLAEDAVQETFLRAYKSRRNFRGACSEKTWLVHIAVNVCRDMHRSAWFRHVDRQAELDKLSLFEEEIPQEHSTLLEGLMELPEKERKILILYYYEDWTLEEIAGTLHISKAAISKRLKKSREKLRGWLEGGGENDV